ncbi:IucA/IucC family protein [Pontivivens ytuae]|uniref:IucA/IucC family siderophore biosynthesis protein n=1 Tax=Pontivivens ytuae TaxID=2789856 RepID=A0A7S9LUP5_9RHOB|nr:IucA/IucC family protein [Pontivivens ytuae]QPH55599.1 IucA/IucC family siderophore biosynthesis protein [Pontivivens ytuae]
MTLRSAAGDLPALDAFLNSALREGWLRKTSQDQGQLAFRDPSGREVRAGLRAASRLRYLFDGTLCRRTPNGWEAVEAETLLADLAGQVGDTFQDRVLDSLAAIRRAPPQRGDVNSWTFIAAEQALKAGHPFHPNPRSRDEMSAEDAARFAPEQEGQFALRWIAARPELLTLSSGAAPLLRLLAKADLGSVPSDAVPLPWHPWQAQRLRQRPEVARMVEQSVLWDLGPGRSDWAATSSMRSLHAWHAPYMVKTSLSLKLTNSVRDLSLREVRRGVHVSDLLQSDIGAEIEQAFPDLHILGEPAYVALRGTNGIVDASMVVLRDNPFRDAGTTGPVLLAALCEAKPNGSSPLGTMVARIGQGAARHWFERFLEVAIRPVLELRARYGLLFGAHQQNLMIELSNGWPSAVWIRDCQGTGHLESFHDKLTAACPGIGEGTENVVNAELGDGLLIYYVVVNSVFNTLSTLVLDGLAQEDDLLSTWRQFLERERERTPGDPSLYGRLLTRPTLTCKGNFSTSMSGVNEADGDARGQLAAFFELPNPILETVDA